MVCCSTTFYCSFDFKVSWGGVIFHKGFHLFLFVVVVLFADEKLFTTFVLACCCFSSSSSIPLYFSLCAKIFCVRSSIINHVALAFSPLLSWKLAPLTMNDVPKPYKCPQYLALSILSSKNICNRNINK